MIIASAEAVRRHGPTLIARVLGDEVAGVAPRVMGIGLAPAPQELMARLGIDVIELKV